MANRAAIRRRERSVGCSVVDRRHTVIVIFYKCYCPVAQLAVCEASREGMAVAALTRCYALRPMHFIMGGYAVRTVFSFARCKFVRKSRYELHFITVPPVCIIVYLNAPVYRCRK